MANEPTTKDAPVDWVSLVATYLAAGLVFYPLARWLFRAAEASEQLFHAFIILAGAAFFLMLEKRQRLSLVLRHDQTSVVLLLGSFLLMGTSLLLPGQVANWPPGFLPAVAMLVAFGVALGALVRFTLGAQVARTARGLIAAFVVFALLALLLPVLDWPLRALAGRWSLMLLGFLGQAGDLQLAWAPSPELILTTGERHFVVAAECNGFGLLAASLLVAVLLAVFRKLGALDFFLVLLLAVGTAFLANALRILVIVLLAPQVESYLLMHEIVGLIFFYSALGFLWWFIWGFGQKKKPVAAAA